MNSPCAPLVRDSFVASVTVVAALDARDGELQRAVHRPSGRRRRRRFGRGGLGGRRLRLGDRRLRRLGAGRRTAIGGFVLLNHERVDRDQDERQEQRGDGSGEPDDQIAVVDSGGRLRPYRWLHHRWHGRRRRGGVRIRRGLAQRHLCRRLLGDRQLLGFGLRVRGAVRTSAFGGSFERLEGRGSLATELFGGWLKRRRCGGSMLGPGHAVEVPKRGGVLGIGIPACGRGRCRHRVGSLPFGRPQALRHGSIAVVSTLLRDQPPISMCH